MRKNIIIISLIFIAIAFLIYPIISTCTNLLGYIKDLVESGTTGPGGYYDYKMVFINKEVGILICQLISILVLISLFVLKLLNIIKIKRQS